MLVVYHFRERLSIHTFSRHIEDNRGQNGSNKIESLVPEVGLEPTWFPDGF